MKWGRGVIFLYKSISATSSICHRIHPLVLEWGAVVLAPLWRGLCMGISDHNIYPATYRQVLVLSPSSAPGLPSFLHLVSAKESRAKTNQRNGTKSKGKTAGTLALALPPRSSSPVFCTHTSFHAHSQG